MPTLYVTESGSVVEREAGQLLVSRDGELLVAVPATRVDGVVIAGTSHVTTPVLTFLLDRGIPLIFLTANGSFRGRLTGGLPADVEPRRAQYRRLDDPAFCLAIARAIVAGKIHNCRVRCLRWDTSNADPVILRASDALATCAAAAHAAATRDELLGIEGQAARRYFAVIAHRLRPPWHFERRARRPPPDPVNALFSLVSTLLHESCRSALEAAGLDPWGGVYHVSRPGRASLALDLMEEFRPVIADAVVLRILHTGMLAPGDFHPTADGGVALDQAGWRAVASQYRARLRTLVRPDDLARRVSYEKLLERQARQLRRVFSGELADYTPFASR